MRTAATFSFLAFFLFSSSLGAQENPSIPSTASDSATVSPLETKALSLSPDQHLTVQEANTLIFGLKDKVKNPPPDLPPSPVSTSWTTPVIALENGISSDLQYPDPSVGPSSKSVIKGSKRAYKGKRKKSGTVKTSQKKPAKNQMLEETPSPKPVPAKTAPKKK